MPTTPPPPGRVQRVHTPPTPLHGPKFDNYEPYSPRRSSRVAAQQSKYSLHQHEESSIRHRSARATTPTNTQLSHHLRTSSQTFSPPSSPATPSTRAHVISPKSTKRERTHHRASPLPASDSDTDVLPSKAARLKPSSTESFGMLQTPAKTPRKRAANGGINGTARVLFPGRPANVEDAMPTPKKGKKSKTFNPFSIPEEGEAVGSSSKIEIYTDSKERVPTRDDDDGNPFLSKNAAKPNKRQKSKARTEQEATMEEATRSDEGMVYVFRGKKIFRKYDDANEDDDAADEDDNLSDLDIRRKVGATASRRFTRSSVKPRLLFPNEEQRRAREAAEEADEEAVTDIEMPHPKPEPESTTPVKEHFQPTTPPSTGRAKRGTAKKDLTRSMPLPVDVSQLHDEVMLPQVKGKKKGSLFDGWSRKKTGAPSMVSKGTKREGEPMERDGDMSKRTRSGAYSNTF